MQHYAYSDSHYSEQRAAISGNCQGFGAHLKGTWTMGVDALFSHFPNLHFSYLSEIANKDLCQGHVNTMKSKLGIKYTGTFILHIRNVPANS